MSVRKGNEMTMTESEAAHLQRALRENVMPNISVDGIWGRESDAALTQYAKATGLDTAKALDLLKQYADRRYVSDDAFTQAAKALGVPESYVRAIAQVESVGASFLPDGRIKVLLERHWFYKKLKEKITTDQTARSWVASKLNSKESSVDALMALMVQKYGSICNTERGGYKGGAAEWDRLNLAMDFNVEAGGQAASYGGYQIMGFNCKVCGYASAKEMMLALAESESKQFLALVAFIKSDATMWAALKRADWTKFAECYNGPSFKENAYNIKLASAEKLFATTLA